MQKEFYIYYDKQHTAILLIFLTILHMFFLKMEQKIGMHSSFMSRLVTVCGVFVVV
jgi:hypothetical protein